VQSLGHEEKIFEKFKEILDPITKLNKKEHVLTGFGFGLSNFITYCTFAALFFFGGMIIENSYDEKTKTYGVNPENVFLAIFAIFWGAQKAGQALSLGPDMAKGNTAAEKIFKIIDMPSKINAIEMDKQSEYLSADNIEGIIEFKDVWFRYPTRKEDFVLRGLNLKISPNESIALVGESGCGKSTFVNLLMRFYDVDFGEILIDGINIKKYNLHSLRRQISLVMQEPNIFNYSIMENILYGNLTATNTQIMKAAEQANVLEFVDSGSIR